MHFSPFASFSSLLLMRYTGPKARRCRRQGVNLYGSEKYEAILQRKPYPPGKTPKSRLERQSSFAQQLRMKQRARDIYGLTEQQFRRVYREAASQKGQTGETMLQLLERRLDNTLYRAGFAHTRLQARQMAAHGLFLVNSRRVTLPSFRVVPGMILCMRPRSSDSPLFTEVPMRQQKFSPPSWLRLDVSGGRVEVLGLPGGTEVEQTIDIRQVVEFYSRT